MALLQITEPGVNKTDDSSEIIIGIDLGTTNSLVGIIENDQIKIFADENGFDIQPSVVAYDDAGTAVAVGQAAVAIDRVTKISSIKRLMGKDKSLRVEAGTRKIRPEEVSAEILKHLKKIAEKNLNQTVKKAVITVPAYFDEAAKNATKLAANLADLEVVRLVNEPTAAALAYGLENSSEGTYCVYDLGGGTFDVSILKMQKGVFRVLGVAGDNHLGGDDFDEILAKKLCITKNEAKTIKENLYKRCQTPFYEKVSDTFLGVEEFENLIAEKINRTVALTTHLLEDLDLKPEEIKGVILVGGSTRIPLIGKKLAEVFGEEKILTNLDPDRVVAIGAAWQAFNLSGARKNLLLDVNPLSLGIEMMGGIVEKIIPRNSTIPTAYAKEFTTYADNQTGMKFHIVQGERELASDCRSLANFEIKGIPTMKAGIARVLVTFKLDADGLLTVVAEEKITQTKQEIAVKPSFSLDETEIKNMLLDSLKNSQNDIENRLLIEAAVEAMQDVVIIENDLEKSHLFSSPQEKKLISEKLKILKKLIAEKTSRNSILEAQKNLAKAAESLTLRKVNDVLQEKITGKKISEITQ